MNKFLLLLLIPLSLLFLLLTGCEQGFTPTDEILSIRLKAVGLVGGTGPGSGTTPMWALAGEKGEILTLVNDPQGAESLITDSYYVCTVRRLGPKGPLLLTKVYGPVEPVEIKDKRIVEKEHPDVSDTASPQSKQQPPPR